jgi:hypothetical protein
MDVKHMRGGDMEIILSSADIRSMEKSGFCMDRNGLVGTETKTWVRSTIKSVEKVSAQIDAASDVYVDLPDGIRDLPARIEKIDIDPYLDANRERVDWHFGETGAIVVRLFE